MSSVTPSQFNITRTLFPALTRSGQVVRLSERGDERLPDVASEVLT